MSDVVERIRSLDKIRHATLNEVEAADEIERLRARLAEAERLLREAADVIPAYVDGRNDELLDGIDALLTDQPSGVRHED